MDKKTKLILGALLLGVLIVGIFLIRGLTRIKPGSEVPTEPTPSGTSGNPTEPSTGGDPVTDPSDGSYVDYGTFKLPADYTQISLSQPVNMYQVTGYHTEHISFMGEIREETYEEAMMPDYEIYCQDKYKVDGLKTFCGSQVYYISQEEALAIHPDETGEVGIGEGYYCFSGNDIKYTNEEGYIYNIRCLREEGTGRRIYVLDEEYIEQFKKDWIEGQKVLSGERPAEEGMIIVNGRLLENYKFRTIGTDIQIPLKGVGEAIDPTEYKESEDEFIIYVPVRKYGSTSLQEVPYTLSSASGRTGMTFQANQWTGNWGFTYGVDGGCYVYASEAQCYTGWKIYTNGTVVVVVSDDVDWSDIFIEDTRGPLSYEEQLEMYGEIVITEELDDPDFVEAYENATGDTP